MGGLYLESTALCPSVDLVWLREPEAPPRPPTPVITVQEPTPPPSPVPSLQIEYEPLERRMRKARGGCHDTHTHTQIICTQEYPQTHTFYTDADGDTHTHRGKQTHSFKHFNKYTKAP